MTDSSMVAALIKAQQSIKPIIKGSKANAGKFSYTYADLGSVLDAVMPALHSNGFALTQPVVASELGEPQVRTTLMHISGEKIESAYPVRVADPADPQKVGGGVTFARRYSLIAILGLATEDDDGQHARQPRQQPQRPQSAPEDLPSEPLHLDQADIDRFMGRIFDANAAEPDDRRRATNALYKEAQQSPELADLLIANLSDYNAARMVADELKKKGLLTAKGEKIINGRAEEVSQ